MDWNRIDTKWHEIARSLQHGALRPNSSDEGGAHTNLRPDVRLQKGVVHNAPENALGSAPGDTMARATG